MIRAKPESASITEYTIARVAGAMIRKNVATIENTSIEAIITAGAITYGI